LVTGLTTFSAKSLQIDKTPVKRIFIFRYFAVKVNFFKILGERQSSQFATAESAEVGLGRSNRPGQKQIPYWLRSHFLPSNPG
jgi:hypothetical protein